MDQSSKTMVSALSLIQDGYTLTSAHGGGYALRVQHSAPDVVLEMKSSGCASQTASGSVLFGALAAWVLTQRRRLGVQSFCPNHH